jgi:hypothetical protein
MRSHVCLNATDLRFGTRCRLLEMLWYMLFVFLVSYALLCSRCARTSHREGRLAS